MTIPWELREAISVSVKMLIDAASPLSILTALTLFDRVTMMRAACMPATRHDLITLSVVESVWLLSWTSCVAILHWSGVL
jgi:hypothetical protein